MKKTGTNRDKTLLQDALAGNQRHFVFGAIAMLLSSVGGYLIPLVITAVIDMLHEETPSALVNRIFPYLFLGDDRSLWLLQAAMLIVGLTIAVGSMIYIRMWQSAKFSELVAERMKNTLYRHLQEVPFDYHKQVSAGDIVQRCTSDVETIRRFLGTQLMEVVRVAAMVGVALFFMLQIDLRMTLVSILSLPFLFVFSLVFFTKVKTRFAASDEAEGRISTLLQENLSGVRIVRAFGQQRREVRQFDAANDDYRTVTTKMIDLLAMYWGLSDTVGYLQILGTTVAGVYFAVQGSLSLGNVFLFVTYVGMLMWPVRQMGRILTDFGKSLVSLARLSEITDAPIEKEPGLSLTPKIKGSIEFEHVYFDYDRKEDVLSDISFSIEKGQTIGILGATGSGKSTLVHLLLRLYRTTKGRILIDGIDIDDIERHHLRKHVGIVLQEPFLYSRTIYENIRLAGSGAGPNEVEQAASLAAVHDVIKSFEKGYDTIVGERGVTLSGGQKQRVAIARMLMQDAPILIFDDSLSAVDAKTDLLIRKELFDHQKGKTILLISHRITTLREADRIFVLNCGRIAEQGTHEELMRQKGLYRRVADMQMAGMEEEGGADNGVV